MLSLTRSIRRGFFTAERTIGRIFESEEKKMMVGQQRGVTGSVYDVGSATNIKFHDGMVPRETKEKLLNQKGVVIWFTGARWKSVDW